MNPDSQWMQEAIELAKEAGQAGEVPVGAVLVRDGIIVGRGRNGPVGHTDPTAHAEIVAIRRAAEKLGDWHLTDHTLVVTLEPCAMCAGAIAQSRLQTVVFGAWDEKAGAVGSVWDLLRDPRSTFRTEVRTGVMADECGALIKSFIQEVRKKD